MAANKELSKTCMKLKYIVARLSGLMAHTCLHALPMEILLGTPLILYVQSMHKEVPKWRGHLQYFLFPLTKTKWLLPPDVIRELGNWACAEKRA